MFKYSIQDIVDELEASLLLEGSDLLPEWLLLAAVVEQLWCHMLQRVYHHCCVIMLTGCSVFQEMRKTCKLSSHKSHVSRLLFILTRCSRLVLSGEQCHCVPELHACP